MTRIEAPWPQATADALNRYQASNQFHPFTCGRDHDTNRVLFATPDGWVCSHPECGYRQSWAHKFMAESV